MSDITEDLPFPAEADLAAAAAVPVGQAGRFQLRCAEDVAYVIDTTDGRTWRLDGARWVPLAYGVGIAAPAP